MSAWSSLSREGDSTVAVVLGANARLANAPLVDLIELPLTEVVTEERIEERAAGRELVPRAEHAARLGAEHPDRATRRPRA